MLSFISLAPVPLLCLDKQSFLRGGWARTSRRVLSARPACPVPDAVRMTSPRFRLLSHADVTCLSALQRVLATHCMGGGRDGELEAGMEGWMDKQGINEFQLQHLLAV